MIEGPDKWEAEARVKGFRPPTIDSFKGEYRWLSNFWPARISYYAWVFPTVEHAYVFEKVGRAITGRDLTYFMESTPGEAKKLGRKLPMAKDFETDKVNVMRELIKIKFGPLNADLIEKLLSTGTAELVEGNTWNDTFWGVCNGKGQNVLGNLLMERRKQLCA